MDQARNVIGRVISDLALVKSSVAELCQQELPRCREVR